MDDGESKIGVGIVGFGKIAQDAHVGAIEDSTRFFLHSVADRNDVAAPVPRYPDIDAMLSAQDRPDAVAICTPPHVRFYLARQALSRRAHVLLEKPPCTSLDQAETLRTIASESGISLFCAWHSQFAPAVAPAREWLTTRRVTRARINWREDVRFWHPGQAWIWEQGGFGVFDPGINALSIATKILPTPLVLRDALLRIPENCETPVSAELTLSDANGIDVTASFDFLQTGPQTWEIEIESDDGRLHLLEGGGRLLRDGEEMKLASHREYPALYAHFGQLIDSNRSDVDLEPLRLATEALRIGRREIVQPFHEFVKEQ